MRPRLLTVCAFALGVSFVANRATAQVIAYTWTGNSTTNGLVSDSLNWGGSGPSGIGGFENLIFGASGPQTNVLVPTGSYASLSFNTGRPVYTFSGSGVTPVLTLNGNITVATGNAVTMASSLGMDLATGFDHVMDIAALTTLQLNGVVSGGGHLSKVGAGTLVLTGANTFNYTGGLGFVNSTAIHAGTIYVDGGAINHGTSGDLFVGENNGDNGSLWVLNGGDISGYFGVLGQSSGSTGSATLTGVGSTWTTSSGMGVGYNGSGTLAVLGGATVSTPTHANNSDSYIGYGASSSGTATVSDAGTSWSIAVGLDIGYFGTGSLTISSGGAVSDARGRLGVSAGGSGTVTVNNATWTNSAELLVGSSGAGTLTISNGGDVTNTYSYIATQAGSSGTVTVDGAGSTWTNSGLLAVGQGGAGSLAITGGGAVASTEGHVGYAAGSSGTATVAGTGSAWTTSNNLTVGNAGTGALTLASGGTANVNAGAGQLRLGDSTGGIGTLNIGAAAASAAGAGGIVNAATITTGGGTGTLQFNTTATSGTPYYLTKDGTAGGTAVAVAGPTQLINSAGYNVLTGNNTYTGNTTVNGGTLQLGSANALPAGGNLVINTTSAGQTGSLSIGSGLTVSVGSITYGGAGAGSNANNVITFPGATLVLGGNVVYDATNNPSFARLGTGSADVVQLGATRTFTIGDSSNSNAEFLVGSVLTGAGAGIIKEGAGVMHMSLTTSTYTGPTVVNAGVFSVNGLADGGMASSIGASSNAAANLVLNNATFRYAGDAATTDRLFTIGSGGASINGSGTGAIQFLNTGTLAFATPNTAVALTLTGTTFYNSLRPILTDNGTGMVSLNVSGGGLWFINGANTYTGPTTITNGTLATGSPDFGNGYFTDGGLPSGLGASSSAASNLVLNGGTLMIEGPAASSDRLFTIGTGGATLTDLGPAFTTGPITFSNTGAIALTGTNTARNLTLAGSSGYLFTLNPTLGNNGTGATSVIKNGSGLWRLNGANTYSGGTTINAGTLIMGNNSALGSGAVTLNGGTLNVASGITLGNALNIGVNGGRIGGSGFFSNPLTLGNGVKIAPGSSPGTINFLSGLTLNDGGILEIEIRAPTGTAGTDWDFVNVTGTLNLSGLTTGGYTLKAISLDLADTAGQPVTGLTGPASWTIGTASAGITGFQAADFIFDTSQFYGGGNFSLSVSGNNLLLNFTPVPEPSTYALMLSGLALASLQWRRRRNRA